MSGDATRRLRLTLAHLIRIWCPVREAFFLWRDAMTSQLVAVRSCLWTMTTSKSNECTSDLRNGARGLQGGFWRNSSALRVNLTTTPCAWKPASTNPNPSRFMVREAFTVYPISHRSQGMIPQYALKSESSESSLLAINNFETRKSKR